MQLGGLGEEEEEEEAEKEKENEEGGTARIDEESVERWLEVGRGWVLAA